MRKFLEIMKRDIKLSWRHGGDGLISLAFFIIAASLFPLGIGPEVKILSKISIGVIWIVTLLSILLSLDKLFYSDHEDGSLELMLTSPISTESLVAAKCLANWIVSCLPIILLSPLMASMLYLHTSEIVILMITLFIATPLLVMIGAVGSSLTIGTRLRSVLTAILVLPLYTPVLIFGTSAVEATVTGMTPNSHIIILFALLLGMGPLLIIISAMILRNLKNE